MDELELARKIAAGDPLATEQFVTAHYASVFRLMRHLTRQREDAEDLTQQAFIVARTKIVSYRGAATLRTWIHRIAFNEYAQWKRKRQFPASLNSEQSVCEPGFGAFIEGESLLSALSMLPDKLRETFVLHEIEELPVSETARVMRIPTGTVKARLFHARRRLRAILEEGSEVKDHEPKEATI